MKSLFLILIFFLSACGTDSGNPGATNPTNAITINDVIAAPICTKLNACFTGVATNCRDQVLIAPHLTAAMGLNETVYPTLQTVLTALQSGTLSSQVSDEATCQAAITSLSCSSSEVVQAYSATDFSEVSHLLSASTACQSMVH